MSVTLILLSLAIGSLGGLLAGLLGVGGGIIIVPAVRFLAPVLGLAPDYAMHAAVATSVALIVPTSLSSARSHHRRGAVDFAILKVWGPALGLGSLTAGAVAGFLPTHVLGVIFGVVAMGVGMLLARGRPVPVIAPTLPGRPAQGGIAFVIGALSSWMGIGGGSLSVPTLSAFAVPVHRAVGTSAALGLCISVPGLVGWIISGWNVDSGTAPHFGFIQLVPFGLMLVPMIALAPLGARLAHALPAARLRQIFGIFLIVTALTLLAKSF
ncbi:sulfite exporter TauE/SafE family protein [Pedomonas sp. V897]|uniref:sulfite exporter TauE/SafE family protein n=1 Tax=Pedomonas sp. V897 TaxID=3446482 RepID=UPI003EE2E8D9